MEKIQYYEVFTPGGMPTVTYNPRTHYNLEEKVRRAKQNINKLIIITGQTKSGKTVLTNKVFPYDQSIWIDGGSVTSEDHFWENIVSELQLYTETEKKVEKSYLSSIEAGIKAGIKIPFLSAGASGTLIESDTSSAEHTNRRELSNKTVAINTLKIIKTPLIIDDFHYIPKEIQTPIIRALKAPIMRGLPVIFIAIPSRKFDVIKVEKEMTGRIEHFDIPIWSISELEQIAKDGFLYLNIEIPEKYIKILATEALGSPHLMQEFCKAICEKYDILEEKEVPTEIERIAEVTDIFKLIASNSGRPMFEKLARGPRQRSDRISRKLKNGTETDIYGVVMNALLQLKPGVQSINYDVLRGHIRDIIDDNLPQMHEVSRVLEKMSEISFDEGASSPVIDWEKEESVLTITDPFFAFYLRWVS